MHGTANPNPYSAPAFDAAPPTAGVAHGFGYKPQRDRVLLISITLGLFTLSHLVSMWSCLAGNEIVGVPFDFMRPREAGEPGVDLVQVSSLLTYLFSAIVIAMFFHRANKNARALGGDYHGVTITPGWTVGWFVVPIAQWWKPFQAIKEIWGASQPGLSGILPLWWGLWLLMSIGGRVLSKLDAETAEEITRLNFLSMGHSVGAIAAAAAVFAVVRGLDRIQQCHHETGRQVPPGE